MARFYICAETYNWTHNEMLNMLKRILNRYYGLVLRKKILEQEAMEKQERKLEKERRKSQPKNWKPF